MEQFNFKSIGKICVDNKGTRLVLDKEYIPALTNLEDFRYINVFWWFDKCNNSNSRTKLIALTCSYITYVDFQNGIIGLSFIDADNGSHILDIKPYLPSLDRVENPLVPT